MYPIVQTDNELLQRYINGDEKALAILLKTHQRKDFFFYHDTCKKQSIS
jgi:hypothetical protein